MLVSRLMRWKTSKGEVAPVFIEKSNGYSYSVYGYMNVDTKEYYSKSQFNGRLRQVTGQEQLNRWMLMLRLWQEICRRY